MRAQDYARITELEKLARDTYADAHSVNGIFYDGQPLVEVWTGNRASVFTREHVLAQHEANVDLAAERALEFA